jgi:hypothetical protein
MNWKQMLLVLASVAGAAIVAASCGGDDNSNASCNSDSDCSSGQICHPLAKFCVKTCSQNSDCPDSENNCANLTLPSGQATTAKICQCTTDSACGGGTSICGSEDKVCEVKCTQDSDCKSGRTCTTATGQCTSAASNACNPNNAVIGANGGPDTCHYGEVCSTDNQCHAVQNGGCAQASAGTGSNWTTADTSAPVITSVTPAGSSTSNPTTQCGDSGPMTIFTVDYYSAGGLTSQTAFAGWRLNMWSALNSATSFTNADFSGGESPPVGADFGEVKFGVCGTQSGSAAVYVSNDAGKTSNTVCVSY